MEKYIGNCKRNADYYTSCDGNCTQCKVVNAETRKFDIQGFMEQATPVQLDMEENKED